MVTIYPPFERSILIWQRLNTPRILDSSINFQAIPDSAGITRQSSSICLAISCDLINVKPAVRGAKIICFSEYCDPRKPSLIDLQYQTLIEQIVIILWKARLNVSLECELQ